MTAELTNQIVFIIISALMLGSGFVVVTDKNLFRAALAMIASFLFVAAIYITLDAGFMAAAQLLVYIGAISILVIFAIMLTRRIMVANEPAFNSQKWLGAITAVFSFGVIVFIVAQYWPTTPDSSVLYGARPVVRASALEGAVVDLGQAFVSADAYVLPFEIASVLLLAAMIGAIFIAWPTSQEDE